MSALDVSEIVEQLDLPCINDRRWRVVGCSAISGEGLDEAFEWMHYGCSKQVYILQLVEHW